MGNLKFKIIFLALSIVYAMQLNIFSQSPNLRLNWSNEISTSGIDSGLGLVLDKNDNTWVVGEYNFTGDYSTRFKVDAFVSYYDSNGIEQKTVTKKTIYDEYYTDAAFDSSGNMYATGIVFAGSSYNLILVKYSNIGKLIWTKKFEDGYGQAIAIDKYDNIFVAGTYDDGTNLDSQFMVKKFDTNGNSLKTYVYGSWEDVGNAHDIVVNSKGDIIVVGQINLTYAIMQFDSEMINYLWWNKGCNDIYGYWYGVELDLNDNIYLTGVSNTNSHPQTTIVSLLSGDGNIDSGNHKEYIYTDENTGTGRSITLDKNNDVYIISNSKTGNTVISKLDQYLNPIWEEVIGAGSGNAISLDANENIFITGSNSNGDAFVSKYTQN